MHLTTTNPVSGVWRQNTRAGVIPAILFTRLSRRNARISAHAVRMRAFPHMRCECAHMRAFSRMRCECVHMRAFPRMRCDAMRCECAHAMRCECAHEGGTYACPVLYINFLCKIVFSAIYITYSFWGRFCLFLTLHSELILENHLMLHIVALNIW